jgi:hypothetical protein
MKNKNTTIEELTSKISIWSAGLQLPMNRDEEEASLKMYAEILNQLGHNVRQLNGQLVADMNGRPFKKVTLKYEGYKDIFFNFDVEGEGLRLPQISSLKIDTKGSSETPSFNQVSGGLKYSLKNAGFTTSTILTVTGFFLEDMKITEVVIKVNPPFHWWK